MIRNKLLLLILLSSVAACTTGSVPSTSVSDQAPGVAGAGVQPPVKGAPEWVNRGSSLQRKQDARVIQGVAAVQPLGDLAQQKAVADDRARAEVARQLEAYVDALASAYRPEAGSPAALQEAALVPQQIRSTGRAQFSATRITASWRDPQSNTIWSIAELDVKYVKFAVAGLDSGSSGLKRYIESSADNIFDRFVKEKK